MTIRQDLARRTRTTLTLSAVALALAVAAASYFYPGWSNLRYLTADPQTRQRLDTEQLERGYRDAAKRLEQQLKMTLPKDGDTEVAIESCNSVILNARQKSVQIQKELSDEVNSFLIKHSRTPINLEALHMENLVSDTLSIKEIRVDSVSDKPKSIRTDNGDLLQRYRSEVYVTISIHRRDGKDFTGQETFVASATPQKQWTFPSVAEVIERNLASLRKIKTDMQSATDLQLDQVKRELELKVHQLEYNMSAESPR